MGRKPLFKHEEFIDAAIQLIAEKGLGRLTIAALSERTGAPIGSVYHRFPSRDVLMAELWLKIIESFQNDFLRLLAEDGLKATLFGLEWVRAHPHEARVLLLYRREDLTGGEWPRDLQNRARRLSDEMDEGIRLFTKKMFGRVTRELIDRVLFVISDAPIGIFRRYLQYNIVPPESVGELLRETYNAIMEKTRKH